MTAGALGAAERERSSEIGAASSAVSAASTIYRTAYVAIALGIVALAASAAPDPAALALDRFLGARIVATRAIPLHLGAETFTAAGAFSGGLGWLGALTVYVFSLGSEAIARFVTIVATLATFALVELRARRAAGRVYALAAVALAAACALGELGIAGGIVTALFATGLAYLLERPGPRTVVAVTLLTVIWCNVAPQGLLAPAIAICLVAFKRVDPTDAVAVAQRRWGRIACAATALAIFATPALFSYPLLAFEGLRVDRLLSGIVAYHPMDVAPLAYRLGFGLAVLAALATGTVRGREDRIPLLVFAAMLALANGAYVVVFGALAAPLLAASAVAAFGKLGNQTLGSVRGDAVAGACVLAFGALLAWHFGAGAAPPPGFALAASLARDSQPHRLYCANVDWCDAALAGSPRVRVFMDGRVAAYPNTIWDAEHDTRTLKPHWRKRLDDFRVDTLLLQKDRAFATIIAMSGGWREVAGDASAVLYERRAVRR